MSAKKHDILTVIVPTRDRPDTLVHCLHTITSQENPNMEIIVSDNFSGPEVKKVVDAISDKRLRYIRTSERMGMSEHWDFALNHVKGDWVTIIGDDDGLLPGAVDKFFAMSEKHPTVKAITAANCWYRWPSKNDDSRDAKLCIIGGKGYEVRDCKEAMKKNLQGKLPNLPTIYTGGFIHMDIINKVKSLSPGGKFFQSIIPDVYSGMAVCSVTDQYIYCWEAWGMAGSSNHSNGRQHKDKTKEEMKKLDFHQENSMKFLPSLGDGCTEAIHILIYESFLQSQHLRPDNLGVTLFDQLVLSITNSGSRTKKSITEYCREIAKINNVDFDQVLKAACKKKPMHRIQKLGRKIARHIPGMSKVPRKVFTDPSLKNVYDATKKIEKMTA